MTTEQMVDYAERCYEMVNKEVEDYKKKYDDYADRNYYWYLVGTRDAKEGSLRLAELVHNHLCVEI